MKKTIFMFLVACNSLITVAQSDSTSSNAINEVSKLTVLTQLTESQHAEILKILQSYYNHKESLIEVKENIVKEKEKLQNLLDLVRSEETTFDDRLKYVLTQHQYENCIPYFKERREKINKANGIPKPRIKTFTKTAKIQQGSTKTKLKTSPKTAKIQGS